MSKTKSGFTIVELLIVIVVIGILAAITIVAYNGIQQRARDAKRMDDVTKIVKAIQLWGLGSTTDFETCNGGSGGGCVGWFDSTYSPYASVKGMLITAGYLSDGIVDPINSKSGNIYSYMISKCVSTDTRRRVIFARLENPPTQTPDQQLGVSCTNSNYTTWIAAPYSMNYVRIVEI